jgi:hypothetical protein
MSDLAGSGKTTTIKRVAHDLALSGVPVLNVCTNSLIKTRVAKKCIALLAKKAIILVDGFADHIEQIIEILDEPTLNTKVFKVSLNR